MKIIEYHKMDYIYLKRFKSKFYFLTNRWFDETEDDHIHVDLLGWPYNKECSNVPEAKFDETLQRLKDQYEREER